MSNTSSLVLEFFKEHRYMMLELSLKGQELGIFNAVDFQRALFAFAGEVGAKVVLSDTQRCGVSLYVNYWQSACAFMPDHIARTDLIHALLFIYIKAQGGDAVLNRKWASRRGNVLGRLVTEDTLISDVVNALRSESWIDVEAVEALINRPDVFDA